MHVVQVNYAHEPSRLEPEAFLERCPTLGGWSEALLASGATRVTVVQRFWREARLRSGSVEYLFVRNGESPRPAAWAWLRRLHASVASQGPDIVHVNGLIFPVQLWTLRRHLFQGIPIVVQDHAATPPEGIPDPPPATRLKRFVWRKGLAAADAFLFTAAAQAGPWREAGLIGAQPVFEVVEASRSLRPLPRDEARAFTGLQGAPALLWIGRLDRNKDPLAVLEGFDRASPSLAGAHLTMVHASDDLLPEVRSRLRASPRLAGRVHLLGRVPHEQVAALLSAADLFVLGSHREGSGYALIEALACGAVPVVTDIPPFRVLTRGGTLGALWSAGDPASFAAALATMAGRNLESVRGAIAAHFEEQLSWPAIGRRALAAYQAVLDRRPEPR